MMRTAHSAGGTTGGPDYQATDTTDLKKHPFPATVRLEFRVYFEEEAYRAMKNHAETTTEVELGGVLVGDVLHDGIGPYLRIAGSIPAEGAKNRGTQITFTHEAWDHINRIRDAKYPEQTLVGWYHTHPGFGIFLSEMDVFIQQNFFNQPFHVAVVLETKANEEGCFVWQYGKPTPITRYWAGSREIGLTGGTPAPLKTDGDNRHLGGDIPATKAYRLESLTNAAALLLVGLLVIAVGLIAFKNQSVLLVQQKALSDVFGILERVTTESAKDRAAVNDELSVIKGTVNVLTTHANEERISVREGFSAINGAIERAERDGEARLGTLQNELSSVKQAVHDGSEQAIEQGCQMLDALDAQSFLIEEILGIQLWSEVETSPHSQLEETVPDGS